MARSAAFGDLAIVLAQGSAEDRNAALVWIGVLIGVVLLASVVILMLRRRLLRGDDASDADVSRGLLDDLREARARGDLSEEEFERARLKLVSKLSGKPVEELARKREAELASRKTADERPPAVDLTGDPLPRPRDPGGDP